MFLISTNFEVQVCNLRAETDAQYEGIQSPAGAHSQHEIDGVSPALRAGGYRIYL